jgi:CheY-like chemotaxis protein
MGGELVLDTEYDSGIAGHPGTRFLVKMNQPPVDPLDLSRLNQHVLEEVEGGGSREFHFRLDELDADDDHDGVGGGVAGGVAGAAATDSSSDPSSDRSLSLPQHLNVLFVDDDAILRKLFSRKIKTVAPDWTVREAANGETALLLVEKHSFDLIFMDQYMASVEKQVRAMTWSGSASDRAGCCYVCARVILTLIFASFCPLEWRQLLGTETVQALRSKGVNCRICGLSANDKEQDFLQAGADVFCIKPFPCEAKAMRKELRRILRL